MRHPILVLATAMLCATVHAQPARLLQGALEAADSQHSHVLEWRRHIHQNPELPWQEVETARYVAQVLAATPGFEVQTGIAGTGIKAVLHGGRPGPVVAIRAELDALPVQERNDLPFKSTRKATYRGVETHVAHVCGHDAHVAMLLGAARVFSSMRAELSGTVVLLFQPAEEGGPGNGGAVKMLEAGVLEDPKVDVVLGQHVSARAPSGTIAYRAGPIHAGAENFMIKLTGRGGHGSSPWAANDPVIAAAEIVQSLQGIISHQINQQEGHTVLTIGLLQSGNKTNILPEMAEIGGTIRSLSPKSMETARESVRLRAQKIAEGWRLKSEVKVGSEGYDTLISDPTLTRALLPAFAAAAGAERVAEVPPSMASDDFAALTSRGVPGVFWHLYASPHGDRPGAPNHSPEFVLDESAMKVGVRALVAATLHYMSQAGRSGIVR